MSPQEAATVQAELAAVTRRAEVAEEEARRTKIERDHLRALLSRIRTSLAEFNDPVADR